MFKMVANVSFYLICTLLYQIFTLRLLFMRNYVPDAEIACLSGLQVFSRSNLNPLTSINEWSTSCSFMQRHDDSCNLYEVGFN